MISKTILVLANSIKKKPGRCIAGREIDISSRPFQVGGWLRPVGPDSESKEGELHPNKHCRLESGGMPQLLDVVEVPTQAKRNDPGQPENWEVVSGQPWKWKKRVSAANLGQLAESPSTLWDAGGGCHDRVSVETQASDPTSPSLVLIRPTGFHVRMWTEYNDFKGYNQRKTKGVFTYASVEYSLSITDDAFTHKHCHNPSGEHVVPPFGDGCLLCISLGAGFNGYHYKLIAAVIPLAKR